MNYLVGGVILAMFVLEFLVRGGCFLGRGTVVSDADSHMFRIFLLLIDSATRFVQRSKGGRGGCSWLHVLLTSEYSRYEGSAGQVCVVYSVRGSIEDGGELLDLGTSSMALIPLSRVWED